MTARKIAIISLIAAAYVVLTYTFAPLSYDYIQFRISEILTVLPFITRLAIPGLLVGTIIANLSSPFGIYDIVFGSLATLIAAWLTSKMPHRLLAPLPPVLVNAVIIGSVLGTIGNIGVSIPWAMLYVGLGQFGVCYLLGIPFLYMLERIQHLIPKK
ncbi:QueT transporter family protein [Thermoflavimicrobium dichotomicum]|uniref:Uncharacterized membrane protein n=1 Tax=Thermoflavimicrobium dichotomicum TaxID=46223 RepID=A0A1I3LY83_9BACL|nr:QueT transporter family protein [Thermoflavimicrobium dichotomicum]SFI89396.1 Uncharacterized membrane protein [Thermoflavimicrobium dichotomicum]